MTLFINYTVVNDTKLETRVCEWKLPEGHDIFAPLPTEDRPSYSSATCMINPLDVLWVQASRRELQYIETNLKNIPGSRPLLPAVRWFGSDAQFIFANL